MNLVHLKFKVYLNSLYQPVEAKLFVSLYVHIECTHFKIHLHVISLNKCIIFAALDNLSIFKKYVFDLYVFCIYNIYSIH